MKKPDENYIEYRKRVLDPISTSFCAAKWYNATIWLGSGTTASCHHPPAHRISATEVQKNCKALHNTVHKKLMRKQMLEGTRPTECDYCWRIEDMGRDAVSDRVFKTVIYSEEEIAAAGKMDAAADVNLKTLEIAFDRTCNFACSYCNSSFSTTWAKDITKNGPYQNLVSDGSHAYQHDGKWAQPYRNDDENPFIKAFWDWWPELSKSLQELRVTGGEPLTSPQVWKLFDFFQKNGPSDMLFSINSNLGSKDEVIDRLIEKSHYVKRFDLYTSCEAFGKQAEYIRDGLEFDRWCKNVTKILDHGNVRQFNIMMTINSLCLFSITDFMDRMLEWKGKYDWVHPVFSVNLLRFPSFMSPLSLPEHLKDDRRTHLKKWFDKNQGNKLLHEMEKDGLRRLIDYLEVVKAPHRRTSSLESQWRDFRTFYTQYDKRRGKNFRKTFPKILVEWFDSLPVTNTAPLMGYVDGDATKGFHNYDELRKLALKEGWILDPDDENPR